MGKIKELKYYDVQKVGTIKELLEIAVEQAGDKIAFKYKDEKGKVIDVTYKEFQKDTFELGTALNSINMADKHIAVISENNYKWVTVYLTVLKSKGVIVPIDKELPVCDIINVLNDSDSEVLFYAKKYEKNIDEIAEKAPNVKYFIGFSTEKTEGNRLSYNEFKAEGKKLYEGGDKTYAEMITDHNNLKMLVYTSGTTGMAKGVMLSEHNLISIVYYGLRVSTVYDRCLSVREVARIQSFPDSFIFKNSKTSQYQQLANAVPPLFSRVLSDSVESYLEKALNTKTVNQSNSEVQLDFLNKKELSYGI